jgi:deoxyribodipyrimidine photolyase-related protein
MTPAKNTAPCHELRLILGDQLDPQHTWFSRVSPKVVYVLMELRQETGYVLHHAQKLIAFFAAMRDFARQLHEAGHRVVYLAIDDADNAGSLTANLDALVTRLGVAAFTYQHPDEWRLDQQLAAWCAQQNFPCEAADSDHFLATRDEVSRQFAGRRQWRMEHFYRRMRTHHHVLLEPDGTPCGGRWNHDHDNRAAWPGTPSEPRDTRPHHDHTALWLTIRGAGIDSFGEPAAGDFRWPLNRSEALACLDAFVTDALPHFGFYQDAMHTGARRLFHSLLSFALNTKMLHPREVIDRAEAAWRAGAVPIAAAEGFIRQILGWREYVRGVYWAQMPDYAERNVFGHTRPLPQWFWTGEVGMRCLRETIGDSLQHAYAHHIQRLMITGNFALLAGIDPAAVHRWYLGIYIDAIEWVELPNTLGMSQYADGGLLASKPYVSGAAYIDRMSNYCRGCAYDRKARTGPRACPFNALYWDFLDRNRAQLERNPRLALPYRQLARMDTPARTELAQQADDLRTRLETL